MFLPLVSLFAVGLVSLSVRTVTGENSATLSHPDCTVDSTEVLSCIAGNYSIPGNLDLSVVPSGITNLRLGSVFNTLSPGPHPDGSSTIHDNAPPLNVSGLTQLNLYSFQGTNATRLPIEAFLINARSTLTGLVLRGCRIGSLGPTFLQGFSRLMLLKLDVNDISTIDINAFETRVSLSDAPLPVVTAIALEYNEISTLDWAVFAPVAHSLKWLSLNEQNVTTGLATLTLSKPFRFAVLESLELQGNEMKFPSRAILDTLNITNKSTIKFEKNPFCTDEQTNTCSCCEAEDFVTWAHEIADHDGLVQEKPLHLSFSCGGNVSMSGWEIAGIQATLPPKDQYQDCVAGTRSTTQRTMATTTTSRSTTVTSVTSGTRPNELVDGSPVPGGSGWINRSATGLYGILLGAILFLQYGL